MMGVTLPTWEDFIVIVLRALEKGDTLALREIRDRTASLAHLTPEQRGIMLPSGNQSLVDNRIGWSVSYLNRVNALERPGRGHYRITQTGRTLLKAHPDYIGERDLRAIARPDDHWWEKKTTTGTLPDPSGETATGQKDEGQDPVEQIERGVARINDEVASRLLALLQGHDPGFFEQTVVDLLLAMGYGGAQGRGTVTPLSHDGGVDGVIDQDALGLRKVYVQAKRYSDANSVQRPDVQSFVGALSGRADGGLFITTGRFSQGAIDYARSVPARIILIDGRQLVALMIRYGVGVQTRETYRIVRIDEDYFA